MNMTLAIILLVVSLVVGIWLVNGVYKLLGISVYVAGHKVV